jgi:hypothetical protein
MRVIIGIASVVAYRLSDELDAGRISLRCDGSEAKQVQRVGMVREFFQDLSKNGFGVRRAPRLEVSDPQFQARCNRSTGVRFGASATGLSVHFGDRSKERRFYRELSDSAADDKEARLAPRLCSEPEVGRFAPGNNALAQPLIPPTSRGDHDVGEP